VTTLGAIGEGLAEISLSAESDETVLGFGGDAANLCVMAARLGAAARFAGRVGDDELGRRLLAFWRSRGVDADGVHCDPGAPTGLYVNESVAGEHRFVYWRTGSAGSRLGPADLAPAFFDGLDALVVTGITLAVSRTSADAAHRAVAHARERGARIVCVLNHRPALDADVVELAQTARASDVLIASREDTQTVFGTRDPAQLGALLAPGPAELVLTDGGAPALALGDGEAWLQPVPSADVRNAGGAGDALAGAYLAGRLRGETVERSLAQGVAAASLSVEREGCASGYPSADEVASALRELPPAEPLMLETSA
jgi:2-dehydro-3-deoxygluconokinase